MFTENIGGVLSTINVIESNNLGSNSLANTAVKGKNACEAWCEGLWSYQ
jgi:hypothetical protein